MSSRTPKLWSANFLAQVGSHSHSPFTNPWGCLKTKGWLGVALWRNGKQQAMQHMTQLKRFLVTRSRVSWGKNSNSSKEMAPVICSCLIEWEPYVIFHGRKLYSCIPYFFLPWCLNYIDLHGRSLELNLINNNGHIMGISTGYWHPPRAWNLEIMAEYHSCSCSFCLLLSRGNIKKPRSKQVSRRRVVE